MKIRLVILLLSLSATCGVMLVVSQEPLPPQWRKVYDAMNNRRPQTAIQELEPIIRAALQNNRYDEATKAVAMKISLEGTIEGNKPEERIMRLQSAMQDLPQPMHPILEVILANWYWDYFQQNRWRFLERTQTAEAPGEDMQTWDLPRILAEIDKHFAAALKSEPLLQNTPVSQFDALLVQGSMPDSYRPTMFDFVAHDALRFYAAGEQAAAAAQDAFVLQADSPIFGPLEDFLDWHIESSDTDSTSLKAIGLYQRLLAFHRHDDDTAALADADLSRLQYGWNQAFGEEKNARYKAALERFAKRWAAAPISARALAAWAAVLRSEEALIDAHSLAQRGWKAFPESPGGTLCYNLIQDIQAPEIDVMIERVWNNPWPSIHVRYRNLTRIHFRAVRFDWLQLLDQADYTPGRIGRQLRNGLLAKKPDLQWSQDLPATGDYLSAVEVFPVPDNLQPGFYVLIASPDQGFGEHDNRMLFQELWVSSLALVVRSGRTPGLIDGFVLDADTGAPIQGAEVRFWTRRRVGRQDKWTEGRPAQTNADGMFRIAGSARDSRLLLARHGEHLLSTAEQVSGYGQSEIDPYEQTVFFTDRSLYRPGQTIQFKGICVAVDESRDQYETRSGKTVAVAFVDANRQEIARQNCRTNEFGSFSGSFTAPRDRLTGRMYLQDATLPNCRAYFNVEEYKRPKFKVELGAPSEAARLGDTVDVPGTAQSYTGAAIGGARVTYRVVREVRYPVWWYWRCWWNPPQAQSQEIAHGTTVTESNGTFRVPFMARPDPSVAEKDEPVFHFTVYADVTDTTGETRSDQRSVNVAYTALQASLSADDWQTLDRDVKIRIATQSLDGEPRPAKGTLKVYQLQQPDRVHRRRLDSFGRPWRRPAAGRDAAPDPDLSNPNSWPLGAAVLERPIATDASGTASESFRLPAGPYRAILETDDGFGKSVTAILPLQVLDPGADRFMTKIPNLVTAPDWVALPGETFTALWGTGYESGRAYVEVEHRGKTVQSYWTPDGVTQATLEQGVTESMRGGFVVHVTQVRENRGYIHSRKVDVPWTNKRLTIAWEHFVSKLKPGQEESWTAIISGPDAEAAVAEMVATLYDASLDAYLPHQWRDPKLFRQYDSALNSQFENTALQLRGLLGRFERDRRDVTISYRSLPPEIVSQATPYRGRRVGGAMFRGARMEGLEAEATPFAAMAADGALAKAGAPMSAGFAGGGAAEKPPATKQVDLSKVSARTNLNETAFFFPHLLSDKDGRVTMKFTMPEALTEWKLMGFAHDSHMRGGSISDTAVTSKDLMVEPLPPRFLREADVLEFTVKVTNQSPTRQTGTVRLTLSDARTLEPVDNQLDNTNTDRPFDIASKQSDSFSWRLRVPDGTGFLTYKAVGSTGLLSDGEEGYLPVLSRRILVSESLPLPIRDAGTRQFEFTRLLQSADSDSLQSQSLTLQMVSQPAWYAVLALPYLMDFPYECTEQTFNRLYANALAQHIANADPKIRRIFDQWKGTPALDSPLEKHEDLKAVMLEETPWVRQAQKESQARRNVGILFDANRLQDETSRTLRKLGEVQAADGSWPWFPGGRPNDYITLYITTGFGRLRHLGADIDVTPAVKSLTRLDSWIDEQYREVVRRGDQDKRHLSSIIALYLYGRSFFLDDKPVAAENQEAVNYFLDQARRYWTKLGCRQSEAHVAIALKRFGDQKTPQDILASLKERSVTDEELGMFWRDTELSWWWYRAPIETQAMMIEAFDEVMNDVQSVELCRVWLLKQKQTQDWKTTKATADAVYSLLLRGTNLLSSDALVQVSLGDVKIQPQQVEAGTGCYETRFVRHEITPSMGSVTVTKTDPGVAWGSLHWQYLEDMSKVTPFEGTPLTLKKQLYVKENTKKGPVLNQVDGPISVGDELVVRIELRVDRDMEYVHLKDQRPSGVEPVNVLSRYRYQDGLAYYESTRDTASHFFIDYLPQGTYVFEYSTRVVHRGQYQSGMAQIQCMYAPEFTSHSQSFPLSVQ